MNKIIKKKIIHNLISYLESRLDRAILNIYFGRRVYPNENRSYAVINAENRKFIYNRPASALEIVKSKNNFYVNISGLNAFLIKIS